MTELLRDILASPFGSFASIFAIVAIAFYLTHWVTKKVTAYDVEHKFIKDKTDKLESLLGDIKVDLKYLKAIATDKGSDFAQAHSPISLTQKGEQVAEEIGVDKMIANNWDNIVSTLDNIKERNAYDIQQFCIERMAIAPQTFLKESDVTKLKIFAYNTGRSIVDYSIIFAIRIRDKYFAIKDIDVNDVDVNNPI